MEDQKPRPSVGSQLATHSRRGLKPILKMLKCVNWETCLNKEVYCNSNVLQTGSGGEAHSRWAILRNILKKKLF